MVLLGTDAKVGATDLPNRVAEPTELLAALEALIEDRNAILWPSAELHEVFRAVVTDNDGHKVVGAKGQKWLIGLFAFQEPEITRSVTSRFQVTIEDTLDALEAESIHIMREVVASGPEPRHAVPVGSDPWVMLRLV